MARAKSKGDARLEDSVASLNQAMAALVANQAAFQANQIAFQTQMREMDRINTERFARIEAVLAEMSHVLNEHTRILQTLPEAIKEKIGFKSN